MASSPSSRVNDVDFERMLQQYDFIRMVTCDLNGMHLSKLISTRHAKKIVKNKCDAYVGLIAFGIDNEILPIQEFEEADFGNGPWECDPATLRPLPWASEKEAKIAEIMCETCWGNGKPIQAHPRFTARKQLDALADLGYGLYSAFEPEYRIFHKDQLYIPANSNSVMYRTGTLTQFEHFFTKADSMLQTAGIDVQDYSIENGIGQLESPLCPKMGIESADMAFSFRQGLREIANLFGYQISYMAKPLPNDSGSGWHFNHSLLQLDNGKPVMYNKEDPEGLSDVMRHWVAGILEHSAAIIAFASPTVNCYRRLHKHLAPSYADWGINNRFKSVRVKNDGPSGTYVELRTVSSAACVYTVLAATVAAGIDGIKRKLLPPPSDTKDRPKLPATLNEALIALENDEILINSLGKQFVKWYVSVKRQDCLETMANVDLTIESEESFAKERKRYFEFI